MIEKYCAASDGKGPRDEWTSIEHIENSNLFKSIRPICEPLDAVSAGMVQQMKGAAFLLGYLVLQLLYGCSQAKPSPTPAPPKPISVVPNLSPESAPPKDAGTPIRPWFGGDRYEYSASMSWTDEKDQSKQTASGTYVETMEWKAYEGKQTVLQHAVLTLGTTTSIDRDAYWLPGPVKKMIAYEDRVGGGGLTAVDPNLKSTGEHPGPNISPSTSFHWTDVAQDGIATKHGIDYGDFEDVEVPAGKFACIHRVESYEKDNVKIVDTGLYSLAIGAWVKRTQESNLGGPSTTEYELTSTTVDPAAPWPTVPAIESSHVLNPKAPKSNHGQSDGPVTPTTAKPKR